MKDVLQGSASSLAHNEQQPLVQDDPENDFWGDLRAGLEHCQSRVLADAGSDPGREGMGTTLTAAYVVWPRLYVVHVGDSRAYQLRDAFVEGR